MQACYRGIIDIKTDNPLVRQCGDQRIGLGHGLSWLD